MYTLLTDRIFWIYFIIVIFFIIIGVGLIISSTSNVNVIAISITYLISILILLIIVYYAYLLNSGNEQCNDYVGVFINVIFIVILVICTLWAGEVGNLEGGPLRSLSGVLIILGGIILFSLSNKNYDIYSFAYWATIIFIVIWFSLTLYVTI